MENGKYSRRHAVRCHGIGVTQGNNQPTLFFISICFILQFLFPLLLVYLFYSRPGVSCITRTAHSPKKKKNTSAFIYILRIT